MDVDKVRCELFQCTKCKYIVVEPLMCQSMNCQAIYCLECIQSDNDKDSNDSYQNYDQGNPEDQFNYCKSCNKKERLQNVQRLALKLLESIEFTCKYSCPLLKGVSKPYSDMLEHYSS